MQKVSVRILALVLKDFFHQKLLSSKLFLSLMMLTRMEIISYTHLTEHTAICLILQSANCNMFDIAECELQHN